MRLILILGNIYRENEHNDSSVGKKKGFPKISNLA